MARVEILRLEEQPVQREYPGACSSAGAISSQRITPEGYSLWGCVAELADGAELAWTSAPGDQGVYVSEGALALGDRVCPADGALIVDAGASGRARSLGRTRVVHFGSRAGSPPRAAAPAVTIVGPGGLFVSGQRESVSARWFADGTQPGSRIALMHVRQVLGGKQGPAHSHSQDEVIYVLTGSITLGMRELPSGTSLCIASDSRYLLGAGPAGYTYLNYRADVSLQTLDPRDAPLREVPLERGGHLVGDLR
jgi:quercetin dioxygenase-like cupin family protein